MSKNIRSLTLGLKKSIARILGSAPRQANLPVNISLEVENRTGTTIVQNLQSLTVKGQMQDLTKSSVTFVVPFVRCGEHYLVNHGEQKRLKLMFELPNGKVRLTVVPQCYEMILLHDSVQQYLIDAKIVQINEGDAERYEQFLKYGDKASEKVNQTSVELAPDQKKKVLSGSHS